MILRAPHPWGAFYFGFCKTEEEKLQKALDKRKGLCYNTNIKTEDEEE